MNKEQIIDEVYRRFCKETFAKNSNLPIIFATDGVSMKDRFINKIKTDSEFSEKWGLKIEERELSVIERIVIAETSTEVIPGFDSHFDTDEDVHKVLDTWDVPTKQITITYNNETIESYE